MTEERWLTPKEVGHLLGKSHYTIVRWLQDGYLEGVKLQRSWRVSSAALDAFLARHRAEAQRSHGTPEEAR
jgi:excisionase family DNA binding protein